MKETIATLIAYLTCTDPVVQNKYLNLLNSYWHKDNGVIISNYNVNGNGDVTFTLTDGDGASENVVIEQFVMPAEMPMSFITGLVALLNTKVDVVAGKQLSTQDFTTELLNKLNGLENYIHPAFHEIAEINGLPAILDSLQTQVDDKVPTGGYAGTGQNLKDEIDGLLNAELITDVTEITTPGFYRLTNLAIPTNVVNITDAQSRMLQSLMEGEEAFVRAINKQRDYTFLQWLQFRNNIFQYPDEFFPTPDDFDSVTPTLLTTGYVEEVEIAGFSGVAGGYAMFDPEGDSEWVYTALTFGSETDFNEFIASAAAGFLTNTLPRGLIICVLDSTTNETGRYSFLNSAGNAFSPLLAVTEIINNQSLFKEFIVKDSVIGYQDDFIVLPGSPAADYFIQNELVVLKEYLAIINSTNIYAWYLKLNANFSPSYSYFTKQLIYALDATYYRTWLRVFSPASDARYYQFKNARAMVTTGFGHINLNLNVVNVDRTAEDTPTEANVIFVRDTGSIISPVRDAGYYDVSYEMVSSELSNISSPLSYPGDNIMISDIDDTHSAYMAAWVLQYHSDFAGEVVETNDEPAGDFLFTDDFGATYAKGRQCNLIVESNNQSYQKANIADPDLLLVVAHGTNTYQRYDRTAGAEQFFNNVIMVGSGLESDPDASWQTSYGYGVEFIEPTRSGDVPTATNLSATNHQQSPATAFVASKLKAIKDTTRVSWAVVRRAARETASRAGNWDMYRGYGVINVAAAITWIDSNYPTLAADMADRYADTMLINRRITYDDVNPDMPLPKRLTHRRREGVGDPTTADIPEGEWVVWKNTTTNAKRIWTNDGGTLFSSATFT